MQYAVGFGIFGVESSYLVDRKEPPLLDEELLGGPFRRNHARDNPRGAAPAGAREGDRLGDNERIREGTLGARRRVAPASPQIWPPGRCANARSPTILIGMDALIDLFGPWLIPLFGVGTVLLAGGLLTNEMASNPSVKGLGRGAANVGWRLMLLAAAMYFVILALTAIFANMISNLPGG